MTEKEMHLAAMREQRDAAQARADSIGQLNDAHGLTAIGGSHQHREALEVVARYDQQIEAAG